MNVYTTKFSWRFVSNFGYLGGITIAWVEHTADQIPQIVMLQPFCHKDFGIRSLGDRIKDLNQCVTLYPDIPKDKAFGNYYTPLGGKIFLNFFQVADRVWPLVQFEPVKWINILILCFFSVFCFCSISFNFLSRINDQWVREADFEDNRAGRIETFEQLSEYTAAQLAITRWPYTGYSFCCQVNSLKILEKENMFH